LPPLSLGRRLGRGWPRLKRQELPGAALAKDGDGGLAGGPVKLSSRLGISRVRGHEPGLDGEDEAVRSSNRPRMVGVYPAKAQLEGADSLGQRRRAPGPVGQLQILDLQKQGVRLGEHLPAVGVCAFSGDAGVDRGAHGGSG